MTCRQEVLDAIGQLDAETGRCDFSSSEVLARMRFERIDLRGRNDRTHLSAHMIEGALLRSAPGRVRLRRHSDRLPDLVSVPPVEPPVFMTEDR